jgi:hypothetical protein
MVKLTGASACPAKAGTARANAITHPAITLFISLSPCHCVLQMLCGVSMMPAERLVAKWKIRCRIIGHLNLLLTGV